MPEELPNDARHTDNQQLPDAAGSPDSPDTWEKLGQHFEANPDAYHPGLRPHIARLVAQHAQSDTEQPRDEQPADDDIESAARPTVELEPQNEIVEEADDEPTNNTFDDMRNWALENFTSYTEGLNLERADEFLRSNGIEPKPTLVILDAHQMADLNMAGFDFRDRAGNIADAVYFPKSRLVIINRGNSYREINNGPEFTEALYVHEQAHGSRDNFDTTNGKEASEPRHGFEVEYINRKSTDESNQDQAKQPARFWGAIFNEGADQLLAQDYLEQACNMPKGLVGDRLGYDYIVLPSVASPLSDREIRPPLHAKYITANGPVDRKGHVPRIGVQAHALAAQAMELLIRRDPAIRDTLVKARTDVEGIREFAQRVEALSPGLYPRLARLEYSHEGFGTGVQMIVNELYGGNIKKACPGKIYDPKKRGWLGRVA